MKEAAPPKPPKASATRGKPVPREHPVAKKPEGPMTYQVSRGADVFWPRKNPRAL